MRQSDVHQVRCHNTARLTRARTLLLLTVRILENQKVRRKLIREIIPLLCGVEVNLSILKHCPSIDDISCHGVIGEINSRCIADCEGPVNERALEGMPNTT